MDGKNKLNLNPLSQIRDYLHHEMNENEKYKHEDFSFIEDQLNKPLPAHKYIAQYLDWCSERECVKVIKTQVPNDIASCSVACFLSDIRVQPKRKGTEDEIYFTHPDIREKVSRGNCIFEVDTTPKQYHFVIRGFKKFTGGLEDEDNDDDFDCIGSSTWQDFFLKPIEEVSSVITLKKINGEAAHFSARWFDGELILFAGSKNVHIAFKNREDIHKYCGQRYEFANKVAENVLNMLQHIGNTKAELLLNFMHYTRLTAVMEMLSPDNMHVENLSNLSKCELHFIAWMDTDLTGAVHESLCGLPPSLGIQVASILGFKTFDDYEILSPDQVNNKIQQIRSNYGYEGEVFYYLDSNQAVFGIIKKKTTWYIILRAIREKGKLMGRMMKKSLQSPSHCIELWEKRLDDIQKWLQMKNSTAIKWKKLGIQFLKWSYKEFHSEKLKIQQLDSQFPVLWKHFLEASGCRDNFD